MFNHGPEAFAMKKLLIQFKPVVTVFLALSLFACSGKPLIPYTDQAEPMIMVPLSFAGVEDGRGRFREILCSVLETHGKEMPDYRPCEQALTRVGDEPPGTGEPVFLGNASRDFLVGLVPGLGWDCFTNWLDTKRTVPAHIEKYGYKFSLVEVDGLSGTLVNAGHINSAIEGLDPGYDGMPIILLGYSKGAPDILEFVVNYPQAAARVKAVVSISGAVGGSPLAINATQNQAELLLRVPGSECTTGDRGVVESMLPDVRRQWLADNPLPGHIRYYSVVTYPQPDRISSGLKRGYKKLAKIDSRNDSQVIFYDQIIPGSTLVAFTNADHWAMAVPVERNHPFIGSTIVNRNDYPREVFVEALLRYVDEDLAKYPDIQ
jgi:hypothetical protein